MVGDLLGLGEAAHLGDVRGDDPGRLLLDQLAVAVLAVEVLAGADRRSGAVGDMALGLDVLGRHRVLEPEQVERLGRLGELDRAVGVFPVGVHGDHDLGADGIPDGAHHVDHPSPAASRIACTRAAATTTAARMHF